MGGMIKRFVDCLVEISQESYRLLLDWFSEVFDQINEWIANRVVCYSRCLSTRSYSLYLLRPIFVGIRRRGEWSAENELIDEMVQCLLTLNQGPSLGKVTVTSWNYLFLASNTNKLGLR